MTNETTASQPKSIGDNAQFRKLMLNFMNYSTATLALREQPEYCAIAAFIDSRAPAAQASATIQAAPELHNTALEEAAAKCEDIYSWRGAFSAGQLCTRTINACAAAIRSLKGSSAATIQEPVMVAEPAGAFADVIAENERIARANMAKSESTAPMVADPAGVARPELTVWYSAMPESNGKSNFTAILNRKGAKGLDVFSGYTFARSEYPERVRYEADCMRFLIGEIDKAPFILDYDADKHSGYVPPAATVKAVPSEARIANLEAALRYYAEGNHFMLSDPDAWDTVSGEPFNFQCDEAGTATVEDGSIAKMVLAGEPMPKDDEEIAVAIPKSEGADAAPLADKTGGGE